MGWELDWDSIYRDQGEVQRDVLPAAAIAAQLFMRKNVRTVLDLGCGTGRHSIYFAEMGFEVTAADISQKALEITKIKADDMGLDIKTLCHDMRDMPFADGSFDAVFCVWTTGHGTSADMQRHADEMLRVLKPGGVVFADYMSKEDELYGVGEEIEKDTFINENLPGEERIPHHFSDERELRGVYSGHETEIRPFTYTVNADSGTFFIKANIVICRK
jgi:ubiquinone/menaquinone biosynthesis C-methylase UbiE